MKILNSVKGICDKPSPFLGAEQVFTQTGGAGKKTFYFSLIRLRIRSGEVEQREAMDLVCCISLR